MVSPVSKDNQLSGRGNMKCHYVLGIIIVIACQSGCTPRVSVQPYTVECYSPTANVEVLRTNPPNHSYIEIAELSIPIKKRTRDTAVMRLIEEAKSIGADAIILLGENQTGAVPIPVGAMVVAAPKIELRAIAIKYKSK